MRTASKFLNFLFFLVFFLFVVPFLTGDVCKSKLKIKIAVIKIETANLSPNKARKVTNSVKKEVARYGKIIGSTAGTDVVVSGLASRINRVYVITLTAKDVKNGKNKQATKNLKGSFNTFLTNTIKNVVDAIMR